MAYSSNELFSLRMGRWKARTDLGFLCRSVLNYPDVSTTDGGPFRALHQPIIDCLQRFPVPDDQQFHENDRFERGKWFYTPVLPAPKGRRVFPDLDGGRRVLILDPRGHLKTTVNAISHTIQWILNYPDVAIGIFQANDKKAADILGEIKRHFQANDTFRYLFPEHCPTRGIWDWGTQNEFTSCAARLDRSPKEKSVMTASVEKGMAGYHFDVLKMSDIVDENNVQGNGLEMVRSKFNMAKNLLVGPRYWIDVEGTRYHFGDTYGRILEEQEAIEADKRPYKIHIRSVFKRVGQTVAGPFDLSTVRNKFQLDEAGNRMPWWPERFPLEELEQEEVSDPWMFSTQKLNWPAASSEEARPFPVNAKFPVKIPRTDYERSVRIAYKEIITDMAYTVNHRSNYSVITVAAVSSSGRVFIEEIQHGRWLPEETLRRLLETIEKHYPMLRAVKMEDIAFTQGFMMAFNREVQTKYAPRGIHPPVELIKRYNKERKTERILNALNPWYKGGELRFVVEDDAKRIEVGNVGINAAAWKHLCKELEEFPSCETDDILDTLADALDGKEWWGRETSRHLPFRIQRDAVTGQVKPEQLAQIFPQVQAEAMKQWLQIVDYAGFTPGSGTAADHWKKTGGL